MLRACLWREVRLENFIVQKLQDNVGGPEGVPMLSGDPTPGGVPIGDVNWCGLSPKSPFSNAPKNYFLLEIETTRVFESYFELSPFGSGDRVSLVQCGREGVVNSFHFSSHPFQRVYWKSIV